VVTILANSLRFSEDIVCAAEARAFGGVHPVPAPIPIMPAGRLLFGTSAVLAVMKVQLG
jgi:hypothetical protein